MEFVSRVELSRTVQVEGLRTTLNIQQGFATITNVPLSLDRDTEDSLAIYVSEASLHFTSSSDELSLRLQDSHVSTHRCGLCLHRGACAQPCELQHGRVSESPDIDEFAYFSLLKRELNHFFTEYRALLAGLE